MLVCDEIQISSARMYDVIRIKDVSFLDNCDDLIREFFEYWRSCRGNDAVVLKSNMVPEGMFKLITRMFIVEKEPVNGEYRYRLLGSSDLNARKNNPTGKLVENACAGDWSDAQINYDYVFKRKSHLFISSDIYRSKQYIVTDETLFVPVSKTGFEVDFVYGFAIQKVNAIADGRHNKKGRLVWDNEGYSLSDDF